MKPDPERWAPWQRQATVADSRAVPEPGFRYTRDQSGALIRHPRGGGMYWSPPAVLGLELPFEAHPATRRRICRPRGRVDARRLVRDRDGRPDARGGRPRRREAARGPREEAGTSPGR